MLFNSLLKVTLRLLWSWIATLCDWLKKILRHLINQSKVKPKPIMAYSHAFSRVWRQRHVIALCSDWFIGLSTSVVIGVWKVILQLLWFYIATLCDWLKNLAPLPRPIRSKTKTNHDFLARVFLRLARATCICFELWLVHDCLRLLWLVRVITLVLVLRHSNENRSMTLNWKLL